MRQTFLLRFYLGALIGLAAFAGGLLAQGALDPMKRLAASVFPAGLITGQSFNGPTTERFGVYLILVAALWLLLGAHLTSGDRS